MSADTQESVGPTRGFYRNQQMGLIGWLIFVPLLLVVLPLLPFIAIYWAVSKVVTTGQRE